MNSDNNYCHKN